MPWTGKQFAERHNRKRRRGTARALWFWQVESPLVLFNKRITREYIRTCLF
jgi:hypothetical protein